MFGNNSIAQQTVDRVITERGFAPGQVYNLVEKLQTAGYLTNVRLDFGHKGLEVRADYTGEKNLESMDHKVGPEPGRGWIVSLGEYQDLKKKEPPLNTFFSDLGERTGVKFADISTRVNGSEGIYSAQLLANEKHELRLHIDQIVQ